MAVVRALVTLHTANANPEDFVTNSLYFDDGDDPASWPGIVGGLIDRYEAFRPMYSTHIARNGHEIQLYKMSDPTPRVPVYEETWNFAGTITGAIMPTEVAIVLSFQGSRVSGQPQSRRRGRIYLGPLAAAQVDSSGRPSSTLLTAVQTFGDQLLALSDVSVWTWVAFSTVNHSGVNVTNGWVDNSFDTQRRRGVGWTARTLFP